VVKDLETDVGHSDFIDIRESEGERKPDLAQILGYRIDLSPIYREGLETFSKSSRFMAEILTFQPWCGNDLRMMAT